MKPQVSIGKAKGSWGMTNEMKGKGPNSPTYYPSQSRGHVRRSQAQTPGGGQKVISRDRGVRGTLELDQGDRAIDLRLRGHVPAAHGLIGTISAVVGAESRLGGAGPSGRLREVQGGFAQLCRGLGDISQLWHVAGSQGEASGVE
jgi:hypothetical protein